MWKSILTIVLQYARSTRWICEFSYCLVLNKYIRITFYLLDLVIPCFSYLSDLFLYGFYIALPLYHFNVITQTLSISYFSSKIMKHANIIGYLKFCFSILIIPRMLTFMSWHIFLCYWLWLHCAHHACSCYMVYVHASYRPSCPW